ncbi:LuxR C-terminal-related transcriptional regulator [Baekduia alba]|uniref:LuxR C-terminal-related transcriptional regulator n=1 Tax=Baekduia alba TaxID=2997333 RepID=UPI0032C422D2
MDVLTRPLGPVAEAARRLRGVQRAMTRLSSLDSVARLVSAAPREACRAVGFERAMLSHIRGDRVSFASVSFEADPIMAADFARLARAVRPRLDRCAPEHEAVVRQMPVLVRDAQTATGLFRPLTHVARTSAYVVAPIVRDGHTVGLLHADHFGTGRELDELDRELLWTFATGIGWAMDDIAGRGLRRAREAGDGDEPLPTATRIGASELDGELSGAPGRLTTLTARELEVLHLMSEGASNAAIGSSLVISQATVKSHVRHILRKLGAANRTEAVSLFLATGARRPASASA